MTKTALALAALLVPAIAFADEPSAQEILKKARDQGALNLVGLKADLKLTNIEPDGSQKVRELTTQSKTIDGTTKTISRFKSPPDVAGVALLTINAKDGGDDEIALYAPKVRRTRKIAQSSRSEAFMESEFSYADFSGSSLDDAKPKRDPDPKDCKSCYQITATPKDSPYAKVEVEIDKGNFMPLVVRYFDAQGLLKTYTVSKSEPRANRNIATESVMENMRTHRKSTLSVGNVAPADAPDTAFTERGLERG
ncbi:MAG: outer membrane lipoprotein-sorting protein [Deltaproteobacteria bacterium]|nr:outer membrane lipoprotein-sorting protein [Deltaproteobacteria bacterium]